MQSHTMRGHLSHHPHGSTRGLDSLKGLDSRFQGRYGRLFSKTSIKPPSAADLEALANEMTGAGQPPDPPKDGPDPEESHIPAAYTYLGQFIDHDLTFDPSSFAQQRSDPNANIDFRSPRFDLDCLYGRGPSDQPYFYDRDRLQFGEKFEFVERNPKAWDVPRSAPNSGSRRAIIGDPRNDENVIVSQLQGMMTRFHNRVSDSAPREFNVTRLEVIRHYQWMVIHDFLPRIVAPAVLEKVWPGILNPSGPRGAPHLQFYKFKTPKMPVEFSVAAYRMGHSMVRPGYRLNEYTRPLPIFDPVNFKNGLNAFGEFPLTWAIDWQRFIDLGRGPGIASPSDRVQMAYRIDTSLVDPLAHLPHSVAGNEADRDKKLMNLAFRNLLRGVKLKLPTGQEVAKAMNLQPLKDAHIWIGKAERNDDGSMKAEGADVMNIGNIAHGAFAGKCPLWPYVLAEARHEFFNSTNHEAKLGAVGGTIVAEVFAALLKMDPDSFLHHPEWRPTLGSAGTFTLADLLNFALDAPA